MSIDLLKLIPKEQFDEVMSQPYVTADIDPTFLCFDHIYRPLSKMIPKHWVIIDFGCSYAAQCFYFRNHKKYVGVDNSALARIRFRSKNTIHYHMEIEKFVKTESSNYFLNETFAICSYVPADHQISFVRGIFKNLFVYYPHGPKVL